MKNKKKQMNEVQQLLDDFGQKACYHGGLTKAYTILYDKLKPILTNTEMQQISVAMSHKYIGESDEEICDIIRELKQKYADK